MKTKKPNQSLRTRLPYRKAHKIHSAQRVYTRTPACFAVTTATSSIYPCWLLHSIENKISYITITPPSADGSSRVHHHRQQQHHSSCLRKGVSIGLSLARLGVCLFFVVVKRWGSTGFFGDAKNDARGGVEKRTGKKTNKLLLVRYPRNTRQHSSTSGIIPHGIVRVDAVGYRRRGKHTKPGSSQAHVTQQKRCVQQKRSHIRLNVTNNNVAALHTKDSNHIERL